MASAGQKGTKSQMTEGALKVIWLDTQANIVPSVDIRPGEPRGLITRSIDIRVTEEPANEAQLQDSNAHGKVWQGNHSYDDCKAV